MREDSINKQTFAQNFVHMFGCSTITTNNFLNISVLPRDFFKMYLAVALQKEKKKLMMK